VSRCLWDILHGIGLGLVQKSGRSLNVEKMLGPTLSIKKINGVGVCLEIKVLVLASRKVLFASLDCIVMVNHDCSINQFISQLCKRIIMGDK